MRDPVFRRLRLLLFWVLLVLYVILAAHYHTLMPADKMTWLPWHDKKLFGKF